MNNLGLAGRYRISESVRIAVDAGNVVALDLRRGSFFSFTRTGSIVMMELRENALSEVEILEVLAKRVSATREILARDIGIFMNQLHANGLCISLSTKEPEL